MAKPNSDKGAAGANTSSSPATVVETITVLEDRTDAPEELVEIEYEVEHKEIGQGTTLTTYGEPVGGRDGASA